MKVVRDSLSRPPGSRLRGTSIPSAESLARVTAPEPALHFEADVLAGATAPEARKRRAAADRAKVEVAKRRRLHEQAFLQRRVDEVAANSAQPASTAAERMAGVRQRVLARLAAGPT